MIMQRFWPTNQSLKDTNQRLILEQRLVSLRYFGTNLKAKFFTRLISWCYSFWRINL